MMMHGLANFKFIERTLTKTCLRILWTFWLNFVYYKNRELFDNPPYYLIQRENTASFCLLVSLCISQLVSHTASREKTIWHYTRHFCVGRGLFC